jgi:hypothetical protein
LRLKLILLLIAAPEKKHLLRFFSPSLSKIFSHFSILKLELENLEIFANTYYSELILFVIELITIIFGLLRFREKAVKLFLMYLFVDLTVLSFYIWKKIHHRADKSDDEIIIFNTLIDVVELWVYSTFFIWVIDNATVKRLIVWFNLIFVIFLIFFLTTKFRFLSNRFDYISDILDVMELLFLIPPCIVYYFHLLKIKSDIPLFKRPSFWIITGIFFYSLFEVPFLLIQKYIQEIDLSYKFLLAALFYYLPIIINNLFLLKGFLCKRALLK